MYYYVFRVFAIAFIVFTTIGFNNNTVYYASRAYNIPIVYLCFTFGFVAGLVPKRSSQVQADGYQTRRGSRIVGAAVDKTGQKLFGKLDGLDRHRSGYVPPTAAAAAATTAATTPRYADEPQELFEHIVTDGMRVVENYRKEYRILSSDVSFIIVYHIIIQMHYRILYVTHVYI
jgi:hypothetical protein